MNKRMILYILGKMIGALGFLMIIPAFLAYVKDEPSVIDFLIVSAILIIIYVVNDRFKPTDRRIYGKEGLVVVAFSWILWTLFGSIPFYASGYFPHFLDAFFEATSGFTTTGSSILTNIDTLPMGLQLWRAMTNWIGGMGVLIFVMMLTNLSKDNTMVLLRAEVPGPNATKLVPKARDTARLLYLIYILLTILSIIFLVIGNVGLFDSLIIALSTAGTGGFTNRALSITYYNSAYVEMVVTVFMILFGINFNLYFLLRLKRWKEVLKDEELRWYLIIISGSVLLIAFNIMHMYGTFVNALRYSSFQVASIISTTGFVSTNYSLWPEFSKNILLLLMIVGSMGGSTGGGIKIARVLVLVKGIKQQMHKMVHPKSITTVTLNKRTLNKETVNSVYIYTTCYAIVLITSVIIVSLDNFSFEATFGAVFTTLSNVGPGLGTVGGPDSNFAAFSNLSKIVLCFNMFIGRLEIFPYLILLSPDLWRRRF